MPQREELFYNAYSYGDKLEPGQKIVEQDLAKEFKTSRAPIREAHCSHWQMN